MIIVLKQSVLTLWHTSGWLLLYVVKYIPFPSIFLSQRANVDSRKKIEDKYTKYQILHEKQDIIRIGVIIKLSQTNEAIIGVGMGQSLQTKRFKHDFFCFWNFMMFPMGHLLYIYIRWTKMTQGKGTGLYMDLNCFQDIWALPVLGGGGSGPPPWPT